MNIRCYFRPVWSACFILVLGLAWIHPVQAEVTYSGRAYAAFVNLPTLGVGPTYISDTGPLEAGGLRSESLLSVQILNVLGASVLVATTSGANGVASSSASLADVVVLPGHPAQLTASFVRAESEANCNATRGAFEVVELTFGGLAIAADPFMPNQKIEIPGVATLIVNEQKSASSAGVQEITVNALHLVLVTGDEVILSSAYSDVRGCPGCPPPPVCHDFVTGGGWIKVGNNRANFGFNAGFKGSALQVNFNYIDHNTGMKVRALTIEHYEAHYEAHSDSKGRHFEGTAEVNGVPGYTYSIEVFDNGEPGRGSDVISITLSNGYSAKGVLAGGNIQLHKPCS